MKELLELWDRVEMHVHSLKELVRVRCALLSVACDIPASHKVCEFLGHSAGLGCSKCLKKFPGPVGGEDYSGFNRASWPARTIADHTKNVGTISQCDTVTAKHELESNLIFGITRTPSLFIRFE